MRRVLKYRQRTGQKAKAYDAGKKVSGIKRHIAVGTKDCRITPANVTDRNGAILAFEQNKDELTEIKSYFM